MATKKKVLKKMRAIAAEMPQLDVLKTKLRERIKGAELIKNGITALSNGETVDPKQTYQRLKPVSGPINHVKRMKKAYKKHGASGVNGYISAVVNYVKSKSSPTDADNKD